MISLWSDPWCCLTCHSVVYEINSDIFPGFRTGNFLFELTSCYPVQVIFTVFARIKLQLQTLPVCQPGGRFCDPHPVSQPLCPPGAEAWCWLVVGSSSSSSSIEHAGLGMNIQNTPPGPSIICMQSNQPMAARALRILELTSG